MITNVRIELDDAQRAVLGRALHPQRASALATRKEVTQYVLGCIESATAAPEASNTPSEAHAINGGYQSRLRAIMEREAANDPRLAGKCESYVRGWCKVKFASVLR